MMLMLVGSCVEERELGSVPAEVQEGEQELEDEEGGGEREEVGAMERSEA